MKDPLNPSVLFPASPLAPPPAPPMPKTPSAPLPLPTTAPASAAKSDAPSSSAKIARDALSPPSAKKSRGRPRKDVSGAMKEGLKEVDVVAADLEPEADAENEEEGNERERSVRDVTLAYCCGMAENRCVCWAKCCTTRGLCVCESVCL